MTRQVTAAPLSVLTAPGMIQQPLRPFSSGGRRRRAEEGPSSPTGSIGSLGSISSGLVSSSGLGVTGALRCLEGPGGSRIVLERGDPFATIVTNSKADKKTLKPEEGLKAEPRPPEALAESSFAGSEDDDALETSLDVEFLGLFSA